MDCDYFQGLSEHIRLAIMKNLDFHSLLAARLVCYNWNQTISSEILPHRTNLHIQLDRTESSRKFSKGLWTESILGCWKEITIHYPLDSTPYRDRHVFSWGDKSSFLPFYDVTKVTLYDGGRGTFLVDFIHSIMAGMPNVRYVCIKENKWWDRYGPHLMKQQERKLNMRSESGKQGMKNISNITTFRIGIFDHLSTMEYLNLLNVAQPPLVTLELDFSKNYGLPFTPILIDEVYQTISQLVLNSVETLQNLRIKWDHRVEEDLELVQYTTQIDPFLQFLLMISANSEAFQRLRLKLLVLNFPIVNFVGNLIADAFIPFLNSQAESLQQLNLSRVRWDPDVRRFLAKFSARYQNRFEFGVFMVDIDVWLNHSRFRLFKGVKNLEFHAVATNVFDLNSINARKTRSRRSGMIKWKRHAMASLRFRNSSTNAHLEPIMLRDIFHSFRYLQDLELIDHDSTSSSRRYSNEELNSIFVLLPKLKSLKITNLQDVTDAGLTLLSDTEIANMKETGVVFPLPPLSSIPIVQAKCLRYLELRDLSSLVTDISVFLALQFIPKLEKVALYGSTQITDWGKNVLLRRFRRNPLFEIYIKPSRHPPEPYMQDFP